jgi:predicted transposase/invertase (TIGR01784 family)
MGKKKNGRYLNLITDFGFKFIFGDENNKIMLISFLNAIVAREDRIVNIQYLLAEQSGRRKEDRKAIFDIYCTNEKEERYIIEMQLAKQKYFTDRSLYYATFPIQKQAKKGKWNYRLKPLYFIAILNFTLPQGNAGYINSYAITNLKTGELLSDKLNFTLVELPKFNKTKKELKTILDCWLFCFRYLSELEAQPPEIQGEIFNELFELAKIENLTDEDMKNYEKSVADYADVQLMMECSREEGFEEGRGEGFEKGIEKGIEKGRAKGMEEGVMSVAKNLQQKGMPLIFISEVTGLTPEQVRQIILYPV